MRSGLVYAWHGRMDGESHGLISRARRRWRMRREGVGLESGDGGRGRRAELGALSIAEGGREGPPRKDPLRVHLK